MAREGEDLSSSFNRWDSGRTFDTTEIFKREDRNVFRPMPRNWRSPARTPNRQYDRYFPRTARR